MVISPKFSFKLSLLWLVKTYVGHSQVAEVEGYWEAAEGRVLRY